MTSAHASPHLSRQNPSVLSPPGATHPLLAACLFLVMVTVPRAEAQEIQIGVRFGPTFGFLNDNAVPFTSEDGDINSNPRLDLHAGAHAIVPVTDHLALQPELLYVQKGAHFSRPRAESYAVERYRLAYLQGALLARHDFSTPTPLSLHAVAGLTADVALYGSLQRTLRTAEIDLRERVALMETEQFRQWDVGALVGVGLGYPIGPTSRLALELRYNPGFRTVLSSSARSASTAPDPFPLPSPSSTLRHDVITASLTYTLPLASLF